MRKRVSPPSSIRGSASIITSRPFSGSIRWATASMTRPRPRPSSLRDSSLPSGLNISRSTPAGTTSTFPTGAPYSRAMSLRSRSVDTTIESALIMAAYSASIRVCDSCSSGLASCLARASVWKVAVCGTPQRRHRSIAARQDSQ